MRRPERLLWASVASAAFAGPILILRLLRPELLDRPAWGAGMLALAALPLLLAWRLQPLEHACAVWMRAGSAARCASPQRCC